MKLFPEKLNKKLEERKSNAAFRSLGVTTNLADFSSNDYLGFAKAEAIFDKTHQFLLDRNIKQNGATGSRLLSGNHQLYDEVEMMLAEFHESEAALVFNAGYDANLGFFASVPQRGDVILYDELIHASIRDGIQLSNAKAYKFKHNDLDDLEAKISRFTRNDTIESDESFRTDVRNLEVYVVTESVFSMDGDTPDLTKIAKVCKKHKAYFVVDEAHAVGVFGAGIIQQLKLQNEVFARIVTFGKALGCHGAAILGSAQLKEYLVNFARSFIYTTGLSPHSLATIINVYNIISNESEKSIETKLHENINHFKKEIKRLNLSFIESNSAIHCCIISDTKKTKHIAQKLQENGFDVKPILSPTVPKGQERLRFCLHSYNSTQEITEVLENLATFV